MGNLYEKINVLCEGKGIRGAKLCNDTGISKGLLTDLKMGRRTGVSAVTAQKIARYFDVSVGYLLGEEDLAENEEKPTENGELSEAEQYLIDLFRQVPADQQELVMQMISVAVNKQQ